MNKHQFNERALKNLLANIGKTRYSQETWDICNEVFPGYGAEGLYQSLCGKLPFQVEMFVSPLDAGNWLDVTLRHSDQVDFYATFKINVVGSQVCRLENIRCFPNGRGHGTKFLAAFMTTMQNLGIEEIHINEAEDVGYGYWPKIGFIIHERFWGHLYKDRLIDHINMLADDYRKIDEIREELLQLVEEEDQYALCHLANRIEPEINGNSFAEFFFSPDVNDEHFEWGGGVFYFSDRAQMSFLTDYFERKNIAFGWEDRTRPTRQLQPVLG